MNSSPLNDLAGLISPMALKDRIQELVDAGYKRAALAKAAGKSPAAVTHWLNGETKEIKADSAAGLQSLTGYSSVWISEGKGPKRATQQNQSVSELNQPLADESLASGAININVNASRQPSAVAVLDDLSVLLAGVEPGRMGPVIAMLGEIARNPSDKAMRDALALLMVPQAFTQTNQRTG